MATQSTLDQLFANIDSMIATHVAAIEDHNAQIEALKSARKVLTDNATPAAPKSTRRTRRTAKSTEDEPVKMVTDKQLLWLERKGYDGDSPEELTREEASEILDDLFNGGPVVGLDDDNDVEVEETPRRKRTAKAARTRTKRTVKSNGKSNGSDPKMTRKESILALHEEGLKPKAIAEALDANVSYVYLILRQEREAAK
jgi:hypothetical protein